MAAIIAHMGVAADVEQGRWSLAIHIIEWDRPNIDATFWSLYSVMSHSFHLYTFLLNLLLLWVFVFEDGYDLFY